MSMPTGKALTVAQLMQLQPDDWVWIVYPTIDRAEYAKIVAVTPNFIVNKLGGISTGYYSTYGTAWTVYKNKEQANGKAQTINS